MPKNIARKKTESIPLSAISLNVPSLVLTGGESKTDAAKTAIALEKNALLASKTWVETNVREWADVKREAALRKEVIHVGRIFPIVTEKFSELPPDQRKTKARIVFQGSRRGRPASRFRHNGKHPLHHRKFQTLRLLGKS